MSRAKTGGGGKTKRAGTAGEKKNHNDSSLIILDSTEPILESIDLPELVPLQIAVHEIAPQLTAVARAITSAGHVLTLGTSGKEGVANLKAFVESGGTLICMSEACGLALDEFNLPARNLVGRMRNTEYSLPGTLVNLEVDTTQPLAWGMPRTCAAYYTSGPVFATNVPGAGVGRAVVARFPEYPDRVVASGWAAGTPHMAGRAAVVEARLGKGRVVLFGPRIQTRGQMLGTFKMLFNAILNATLEK